MFETYCLAHLMTLMVLNTKTLQLLNVEITSFTDLVPFLIPLVVLPIGTTTSAISNSPSAASN